MSSKIRSFSVPLIIVIGFSAMIINQRNLRINSFKKGASCILNGVKSHSEKERSRKKCNDYFDYRTESLQEKLDNASNSALSENEKTFLRKEISRFNELRKNGALQE